MFKSLKEKLKGWITRNKEEAEEIVKTPVEEVKKTKKETKKEVLTAKSASETKESKISKKKTKDKKEEKKKKEKEISEEELREDFSEKLEDQLEDAVEDTKEELEEARETKETKTKIVEVKEEEKPKEKKGFFASLFAGKKTEEEVTKEKVEEVVKEGKVEHKEIKRPKEETLEEQFEKEIGVKKEKEDAHASKEETIEDEEKPEKEEKPKSQGFSLFKRKGLTEEKFDEMFEELELILLQNNVAYEAVNNIKKSLKEKLVGESAKTDIQTALQESIEELLINPPNLIKQIKEKENKPFVILFAGINGAGKTTTIAKVAHLIKKNKLSVCLASADTFRAAAIEQLQVHADRLEVPLIKKDYGADPASVGFDAIKYAEKHKVDVVLIDTAGRMNNRNTLMKEIEKIARVNKPDLKIFLGESITGNDATEQAKDFNNAIDIDGIILSKADVDEKGGTAISVTQVTGKPIYYLGTGQKYDDLEIFDKEKLIEKIFS